MAKKSVLALMILLFLLLVACSNKDADKTAEKDPEEGFTREEIPVDEQEQIGYSIWTTYWDIENLTGEIEAIKDRIDNICYFAAYFNKDKQPFIPKETMESFEKVKKLYGSMGYRSYLTFVNDLILEDNTSSLKDVDLLYTLFETDRSMDDHKQDILRMTMEEGFDGIEIDYEAIKEDMVLWQLFVEFVEKLYGAAAEKDVLVRVLLEPNAPLDVIEFPEGPEYVMMCYNLHGQGTKPGPKANKTFLEDMIKKTKTLPGKVNFALATGGYDFDGNGKVRSLTERQAVELLALFDSSPERDEESQALFFDYIDNEGVKHQVWYADSETIKYWIDAIQKSGNHDISLWRMGGNLNLKSILKKGHS